MHSAVHPSAPVDRALSLPHPATRPSPTEAVRRLKLPARHVVYGPTEVPHCLYLVERGRVRLMRPNLHGRSALVALLGPGDVFGEAFRDSVPVLGEVAKVVEPAELRVMSPNEIETLCQKDPRFALDTIGRLATSLRRARERIQGFTSRAVPARLAQTLLRLGEIHGEPCPHGGTLDLRRITQEDLADLSGACRPFVSTLINEMKRSGWVGNQGRVLCLRDLEALRRASVAN
jgi:CRP/FNR family cyclic AMP-dependent transcriptional regulator